MLRGKKFLGSVAIGLLLGCGGGPATTPVGPGFSIQPPPAAVAQPLTVAGSVVNTVGAPIAGADVWVETQLIVGRPGIGETGADGRYQVTGLVDRWIYQAHAWHELEYLGQTWCVQMAPAESTGNDVFAGADGAVRDFQWQLTGPIPGSIFGPDEDGHWWGGTIRVFSTFSDGNYDRSVELTLVPDGPLIDGSVGETVVRTLDLALTQFALDIPVGRYTASAVAIDRDGTRTPLQVAQTGSTPQSSTTFQFQPQETILDCGSAGSNTGVERGFVDVLMP